MSAIKALINVKKLHSLYIVGKKKRKFYLEFPLFKSTIIASSLSNKKLESDVSVFIGSISAELLLSVKSTLP